MINMTHRPGLLNVPAAASGIACAAAVAVVLWGPTACADAPRAPDYPDHTNLLVVRGDSGEEVPVRSPADWQVRRAHILAHLQEVMGPLPGGERRVPLDVRLVETVDEPGYVRKKITFASEPGDRVPAWLLVPKGGPARKPAALCLHQTNTIGKDEPAGLGGKPYSFYAKELAERGYVTIAPDYPNFGEYRLDAYALGYASASMKAIWNNMRALDLVASLDEVDPGRIGVIGHSLGGHNAIFTALFDPRLQAVVSSCGFNSFPYYYKGNIAGWSHKGYMPRLKDVYHLELEEVPFDWPELIGALAPRAFFTNSPTHDDNFAVEGVKVCIASAAPIYQLLGVHDRLQAVHPDAEHSFPEPLRAAAYEFLDRWLKPHAP
jgi:pimeloyl-ACP methyl ester carboxylesterase